MTLSAKAGSFAARTTTGNQAISGLGFQPKVVLFWMSSATADGNYAHAKFGFGAAISSSSERSVSMFAQDAIGTADSGGKHSDAACISLWNVDGPIEAEADFVSMDSDGFTINWSVVTGSGEIVNYLALGGADLTNYSLGTFTGPTSTGNQAVTGAGFQPDCVLLFGLFWSGAVPGTFAAGNFALSAFTSSDQVAMAARAPDNQAVSNTIRYQRTDRAFVATNDTPGGSGWDEATFVSMDSDGFTINWSVVDGFAQVMFYLALKGARFKVGSLTQATSTGNQATTGVGFQPKALGLFSVNATAHTTVQDHARSSVGFATSASERGVAWWGSKDDVTTMEADHNLDRTKVIKMMTEGTPSVDAAADLVSFDSDGFTLNWSTADATARQILYLAFGTLDQTISGVGAIATAEAFGSGKLNHQLRAVGAIASAEAFGTAQLNHQLRAVGAIASAEAFGSPTLQQITSIQPSAIASAEAFGSPTLLPGAVTVSAVGGIASAEAFGTIVLASLIAPGGIASAEAFGTPTLVVGAVTLTGVGAIASAEAFGTLTLAPGPVSIVGVGGIASAEALGSPRVQMVVAPSSIASAEAFGTPQLNLVLSAVGGIASAEAFGALRIQHLIALTGIASAEAFGTLRIWHVHRYRRLRAVQYHALVYAPDGSGGPGNVKLELDPHILNLVWSQTQNLAGQAAFALARRNPVVDQIAWMVDHLKIFRETASATTVVFAGKLVQPVLSAIDVFGYCLDYAGFLQLSISGYRTAYANKKIGSEVISPEWALAKGLTNSPLAFVADGTIQNPLGLNGVTEITTNADFGMVLFDRLFVFNTLAEMSMANTANNVRFEITRTAPHTFNWWRNYGANKTTFAAVWPGNIASYDFDGGKDGQRLDLKTVISDGAGGQIEYSVQAADANTSLLRRLQAAVPLRTLFGATGGTTETDQAKAAIARQLVVSQRYPRLVRITPRQGDFPLFEGNDFGDRFRTIIQKPDESGDFYDGYLLWQQAIGAWEPESGELLDLYLRGQS